MDLLSHVAAITADADDITPSDRSPHLPDGRQGVTHLVLVGPSPRAFAEEAKRVFQRMQIRNVPRNEPAKLIAIVKLAVTLRDEMF